MQTCKRAAVNQFNIQNFELKKIIIKKKLKCVGEPYFGSDKFFLGMPLFQAGLWIRIRIGNPDLGSGSKGKKMKKNKYFFS
jgi:hypothetical protein